MDDSYERRVAAAWVLFEERLDRSTLIALLAGEDIKTGEESTSLSDYIIDGVARALACRPDHQEVIQKAKNRILENKRSQLDCLRGGKYPPLLYNTHRHAVCLKADCNWCRLVLIENLMSEYIVNMGLGITNAIEAYRNLKWLTRRLGIYEAKIRRGLGSKSWFLDISGWLEARRQMREAGIDRAKLHAEARPYAEKWMQNVLSHILRNAP